MKEEEREQRGKRKNKKGKQNEGKEKRMEKQKLEEVALSWHFDGEHFSLPGTKHKKDIYRRNTEPLLQQYSKKNYE